MKLLLFMDTIVIPVTLVIINTNARNTSNSASYLDSTFYQIFANRYSKGYNSITGSNFIIL